MKRKHTGRRSTAKKTSPSTILVVEDNPITSKLVQVTLQKEGYQVIAAQNGKTALEFAAKQMPDLILQDLKLPDIDGVDLVRKLRLLPGGDGVPIIAFTGFVTRVEEGIVANVGFTDFLIKPVAPSHLIAAIRTYLLPSQVLAERPGQGRRLLLVDDDPILLKYTRLQFTNAGFDVTTAHNGQDALDQARKQPPDIIVCDVLMPGMDGFQLCYAVRQDPVLRKVPVVLMSANYVEETDRKLAERIGASAYIYRSLGMKELLNTVLENLSRKAPVPAISTDKEFERERHARITWQLDRMVNLRMSAVQRSYTQAAILNELSLISETLLQRREIESALEGILAHCLDGAGLSKGLLYLADDQGRLKLYAQYGCTKIISTARDLFSQPDLFASFLHAEYPVQVPSPALPAKVTKALLTQTESESALIIPIPTTDGSRGLLALFSTSRNLVEEDWIAFGRSLASQIGQTVALSQTLLKLANSERRYRQLVETTLVIPWEFDTIAWRFTYIAPQVEKVLGYSREAWFTDRFWEDHLHPDDRDRAIQFCKKLILAQKDHALEYRMFAADGRVFWIRDLISVVVKDDTVVGLRGVFIDITAIKKAEEELQMRFEQQAAVARLGQFALVRRNPEKIEAEAATLITRTLNADFAKVLIKIPDRNEVLLSAGVGWREGLVGHATEKIGKNSQADYTLRSKTPVIVEDAALEKRFKNSPLLIEHGVVSGICVTIGHGDNTLGALGVHTKKKRKFTDDDVHFIEAIANILAESRLRFEKEQLLVQTEQRFSHLINSSPSIIYATSVSKPHRCTFISAAIKDLAGVNAETALEDLHFWSNHVHPGDLPAVASMLENLIARGGGTAEYRFRCIKGKYHWIRDSFRVIQNKDSEQGEIIGSWTDITAHVEAQTAVRESEERFRTVAIASNDLIYEWDLITNELKWYGDAGAALGYSPGEFDMSFSGRENSIHPEDHERVRMAIEKHLKDPGQPFSEEYRIRARDGSYRFWTDRGMVVVRTGEQPQKWVGACADITDKKNLEQQFLQAQKMDAVGQLTGGVAHDFNNRLTVIMGNLELLERQLKGQPNALPLIQSALAAAEGGAELTRRMLMFSRQQVLETSVFNMNELIKTISEILKHTLGETITIKLSPGKELWPIKADRSMLENVLLNLAVNARDAMPKGGQLTIETANVVLDRNYLANHSQANAGEHVLLAISDNGTGMSEEIRQHIFEPFFTTKEKGKGTGLGLSMVYGFVKQSNGSIEVYTEPGHGTSFKIYLPRHQGDESVTTPSGPKVAAAGSDLLYGRTILLVEDEPGVRAIAQSVLTEMGARIITADSGPAALICFAQEPDIDLLFTDMVMPGGMTGIDLSKKCREQRPGLRVLYTSGYAPQAAADMNSVSSPDDLWLGKPYRPHSLKQAVLKALGGLKEPT